jgi:copper(I)-binding protein
MTCLPSFNMVDNPMSYRTSYLKILILLTVSMPAGAASNLAFTEAYVAAAPPGISAMAAYMVIENPGDSSRRIIAISSDDFAEVQIHRSTLEKGVARMEQMESLPVEPGSKVELSPGGIHLMLLEPVRDFELGEIILLQVREADGTEHSLGLKVRRTAAPHHHHH